MSNGGEVSVRFSSEGGDQVSGEAAKIDASLARLAAREIKLQTSSLDILAEKLKNLDAALAKNRLTAEQHAAAVARAKGEHQDRLDAPGAKLQSALDQSNAANLGRFAAKIREQIKTPLQESAEEADLLAVALANGLLTGEQHAAAMAKNMERLAAATDTTDKELTSFADRVKALNATPLDRLKEKQDKLTAAVKQGSLTETQAAQAAKRHQDEYQKELDQSAAKQKQLGVGGVAWGVLMGNVYTGLGSQVGKLFSTMAEEQAKLVEGVKAAGDAMGQLSQLGADTPALVSQVEGMMTRGEVKTFEEGKSAVFKMQSVGAQGAAPMLGKLAGAGVVRDVSEAVDMAERLRFTLGDIGHLDVLGKAMVTSKASSVGLEQVVNASSKAGVRGKQLGLSADDVLSAAAVMASAKGEQTGGERLEQFLGAMAKDETNIGKTIPQMVAETKALGLSVKDLETKLGEKGAAEALDILSAKMGMLEAGIAASKAADGMTTLQAAVDDARKNIDVQLAQSARGKAADAAMAGKGVGRIGVAHEIMFNEEAARIRKEQSGGMFTTSANWLKEKTGDSKLLWVSPAAALLRGTSGSQAAEADVALLRLTEAIQKWAGTQENAVRQAQVTGETAELLKSAVAGLDRAAQRLDRAANRDNLAAPRREAAFANQ
jgi:uncharacterized protein YecA (UPF0149 family)